MGLDRLKPRCRWVWVCSCLSRGEIPSPTPGLLEVFDVFEVVGDLIGGVALVFLALSSVSCLPTKDWAVLLRAAREEPKEVGMAMEVGGMPME